MLSRIDRLATSGMSRREFIQVLTVAAAAVGLPASAVAAIEKKIARGAKPSVVWLHFQECTGCTESLLRTGHPGIAELVLDLISLDYHETLFAAAGDQAEAALDDVLTKQAGKFVCIVEGAIPVKDGGIYCKVGGKTALDIVERVGAKAGAIIALGSCASFGGVAAAEPNPTGATGVPMILKNKTVVTLPGCPANPYNLLGLVLQYATFGTLPKLDALGRPELAYARVIHDDCPRRPHFDAGEFAEVFGDEGHRKGWCLYKLGCKGPQTHANCALLHFCDVIGAWPIGIGHPCTGCTEQKIAFRVPMHDTIDIPKPLPGVGHPLVSQDQGHTITPGRAAAAAAIAGGIIGGALVAERRLRKNGNGRPPDHGGGQ